MQRALTPARQRAALRRLARQLRAQDPELAKLLSDGEPGLLPTLHFTSVPTTGYSVVGALLFVTGVWLGVGSAVLWGMICGGLAVLRYRAAQRPAEVRRSGPVGGVKPAG
jgi:Protein of unknown function (DUF3040)